MLLWSCLAQATLSWQEHQCALCPCVGKVSRELIRNVHFSKVCCTRQLLILLKLSPFSSQLMRYHSTIKLSETTGNVTFQSISFPPQTQGCLWRIFGKLNEELILKNNVSKYRDRKLHLGTFQLWNRHRHLIFTTI